jgi:hypothetical protein
MVQNVMYKGFNTSEYDTVKRTNDLHEASLVLITDQMCSINTNIDKQSQKISEVKGIPEKILMKINNENPNKGNE